MEINLNRNQYFMTWFDKIGFNYHVENCTESKRNRMKYVFAVLSNVSLKLCESWKTQMLVLKELAPLTSVARLSFILIGDRCKIQKGKKLTRFKFPWLIIKGALLQNSYFSAYLFSVHRVFLILGPMYHSNTSDRWRVGLYL